MHLPREQEQELSSHGFNGVYTLPSVAELDDEAGLNMETPLLVGGESYEFAAIANLDLFFSRIYRYWHERGLSSILLAGALNLLALAFTAAFSTFLLLFVDWRALHAECLAPRAGGGGGGGSDAGGCDLAAVALDRRPLLGRGVAADLLAVSYISVCIVYLGWTAAHFIMDARDMREVAHFMANKLGISEGKVVTMTWAEVVHRLVLVQRTTRLCIARDLDELHIVSRIMRKENYLIAMINRNVLQLHLQPQPDMPAPLRRVVRSVLRLLGGGAGGGGAGSRGGGSGSGSGSGSCPTMLTKTLEWNLRWCILDHMFDDRFRIRPDFSDVAALKRRLRLVAAANLLLSPFLLMFLLAYFFMRNAERLYHHPAALGSRRWSGLAKWRIRELNELPHYLHHRLSVSHPAALRYVAQFPSHTLAALARFMVFVTGSFVALLLLMTFLDESLLERPLLGRQVVWWLGTMTVVLAACRTLVSEEPVAYDPERALADVVSYTHYLPKHWRGRAHTSEVQAAFLSLFRLKVALFLEELASLLTTPLVLACSLPACAEPIVEFVSTFTAHVDGVGDVCSLALFDLGRHGNVKYGAPVQAEKAFRSRQGKLEKSFLTFVATYPTWEPGELGRSMLAALAASGNGGGGGDAAADANVAPLGDDAAPRPGADALPFHQDPPTVFPYHAAAGASKAAADAGPAPASAAALTRAASGAYRSAAKGITATVPSGEDAGGRRGDSYADGDGGGDFASPAQTVAAPQLPPAPGLGPGPTRLPLPGGLRGPRRPQIPLHLQPYQGVKSYTSNASASQLSAGGAAAGWPWRAGSGGGAGGAAGPVGGSPAPSVASSQFSNLAAPYQHYYPVPLFYAQQQQMRHVQQQHQYRRMYEQLMYGAPSPRGAAAAAAGPGAGVCLPPSPLSPPYISRRMVNSSASVGPAGVGWQHQSLPQPFDVYGSSYMGAYHPFPFNGSPGLPFPPSPPPPPPLHPAPRLPARALQPQFHSTSTVSASPASAGGAAPPQRLPTGRFKGEAAAQEQLSASCIGGDGSRYGRDGTAHAGRHLAGRQSDPEGTPAPPPGHCRQPDASNPGQPTSSASAAAAAATAAAAGAAPVGASRRAVEGHGPVPTPFAYPGGPPASSTGADAAGDGWGSGVSGLSEHPAGGGSRGTAAAAPPAAAAAQAMDPSAAGSFAGSGCSTSAAAASATGSATAAGYGSDVLDLRGLEMASSTSAAAADGGGGGDDDDDPLGLGGFVSLPPPPPPPAEHAAAAATTTGRGSDADMGQVQLEDADGFGLVPKAAALPRSPAVGPSFGVECRSGLSPRRWGPNGSGGSSRLVATGGRVDSLQRAVMSDTNGAASAAWYDREGPFPQQQQGQMQQQWPSGSLQHSQHSYRNSEYAMPPRLRQSQHNEQQQQQQQEGEQQYVDFSSSRLDPSSSQMYYSTDYYAATPYCGIDEYAMYGYESAAHDGMAAAEFPSLHLPPSNPLAEDHALAERQQQQQQQQQQQLLPLQRQRQASQHQHAAGAASLRASLFGDGSGASGTAVAGATAGSGPSGPSRMTAAELAMSHPQAPGLPPALPVPGAALPLNEAAELRERVVQGHSLLQSLYESKDLTVQHRLQQQQQQQ